ncbi:MAG: cyclic nucleotide-binding domain-containing protein [Roseiflexaceae bacterium]|nr:cyclic nucleotide-binding domain-containing protein [Roseiflexaceae bacterium]
MKLNAEQRREASSAQTHMRKLAERNAEYQRRQVAALAQLDCLRGLPELALRALAPACVLRCFSPGTVILNERAASWSLYLVLRGAVTLTLRDRSRREVLIGMYSRGDCFGEGALFGDLFRGAEVRTEMTSYLLQVPLDTVREAMLASPELEAALRQIYRRHLVASTLGRVPLFGDLSPVERGHVASLLEPRAYDRGTLLIEEHKPGTALYLIERGQCAVERDHQLLAYLNEGDFFGEISLLTGKPHNADVRALTPVELLELPRPAFVELLQRQPAVAQRIEGVMQQRLSANVERGEQLRLVGSAIEHGLLRGSHLLVRDTSKCADDCRRCVDACGKRHGTPRIQPGGVHVGGLTVTDHCRQCRLGAECVEACPEGAIQWNSSGALIIADSCTGCGACAPACPYGAITMVDLPKAPQRPLRQFWQQLTHLHTATIPLEAARPAQRPQKCDYCHGYTDLACVSACPTGALRLLPVEELFLL